MNRFDRRTAMSALALLAALLFAPFASAQQNSGTPPPRQPVVINPGQTKKVGDQTITNTGATKKVKATPVAGNHTSTTSDSGAEYEITGATKGDVVNVTNNTTANVSGSGCTVNLASNTTVKVQCTGDPEDFIVVNMPDGSQVTVPGGSSANFRT